MKKIIKFYLLLKILILSKKKILEFILIVIKLKNKKKINLIYKYNQNAKNTFNQKIF